MIIEEEFGNNILQQHKERNKMRKNIISLISCVFLLGFFNNISAETQFAFPTHLDDNFESYTNDSTMFVKWNSGPWMGGSINGTNQYDPPEMRAVASLSLTDGYLGGKAIEMYTEIDSGVGPSTGLGVNWEPSTYSIIGHYTNFTDRSDLTDYSGIRLWVKPGPVTGDQDAIFKINIIESSTIGEEKWMSPSYYITDLDPNGEFIFFDFSTFYEYFTGSGEPMDLSSIKISFLWVSYEELVVVNSTATIWVDNITAVPRWTTDDFESYTSDADLQAAYPWTGVISGGLVANILSTTGGFDQSQAMQIDFDFASGDVDPWAYVGGYLSDSNPVDWSEYDGLSVWVKGTETGDSPQIIQLAIHEGDTTSGNDWGDKFHSADIDVSTLNPDGEYVFLNFFDFVDYSGFGGPKDDGVLDKSDIRSIFVFNKYSGTATQTSAVTVFVDDIVPFISQDLPPNVVDDFERFSTTSNLLATYPWFGAIVGDSISVTLNTTDGAGGTQAMQMDAYFSSGEINPLLYVGGPVRENIRNWSAYDSIGVWLKASETGDSPQFIDIAIHEGDSTDSWGDKFSSAEINISDLDPNGEYLTLPFSDFVRYGGNGGPKDNGILELSDIRNIFVRSGYSGTATQNSVANITVDDITLIEGSGIVITHLDDDFESYADSAALVAKWNDGPWSWAGGSMAIDFDPTGGAGGSKAMEMDFSYDAGSDGPGGITGYYTSSGDRIDMTDYVGISVWMKPLSTTGDRPYFTFRLLESSTIGGDKWIATRSIGNLNPDGEYVYFDFSDFAWYAGSDTGDAMDRSSIKLHYLGLAYDGVSDNGGSANLLVDEIKVLEERPPVAGTHLDDDFDSYANDAGLFQRWEDGPWFWGGGAGTVNLNMNEGNNGSQALQFDFSYPAASDGPGSVLADYTSGSRRVDLTDFAGIGVWLRSLATSDDVPYFTIRVFESSTTGSEKWLATQSITDLDSVGQFVFFAFDDFIGYDSNSDTIMDKESINHLKVGLNYDGVSANGGSATVLIDDIIVLRHPPGKTHLDDNFDDYADNAELLAKWDMGPWWWNDDASGEPSTMDMGVSLDASGGFESSQSMQINFSYDAGISNPGSIIGYYTGYDDRSDLTDYAGIGFWIKTLSTSGDRPYFTMRLLESSTIGGDKWIATRSIGNIDPDGEFVFFDFNDFVWYTGSDTGEAMDRESIKISFIGASYDGTSANGGSASFLIDNVKVLYERPPDMMVGTHLDDDFDSYGNSDGLNAKWNEGPWTWGGGDIALSLDNVGGTGNTQAMQVDFSYDAQSDGPGAVFGYYTPYDQRSDLTGYEGIGFWIKPLSITGDEPYFTLRLLESSTIGGEKWRSPDIVLSDLDPNGEYITIRFDDFNEYNTGSGQAIDLTSIKVNFLGLGYDGVSANGGSASILIDTLTVLEVVPTTGLADELLPAKFALHQNYPNPFNPTTTIRYDLPDMSNVRLVIYDLLGREVVTLVNDNRMDAGFHAVRWNGNDAFGKTVASGVYIYLLQAGDFVKTKKLILLK